MKNAEPTIERLLAGLRDAEPQAGLELRILDAMQARRTIASVPFWKRLQPQTFPAFAMWLASAMILTGAFVAIALHQRSRVPADSSHPSTLAVRQENPVGAITQKAPVPGRRPASRVWPKHSHTVPPKPDLRAASFPAPAAPTVPPTPTATAGVRSTLASTPNFAPTSIHRSGTLALYVSIGKADPGTPTC